MSVAEADLKQFRSVVVSDDGSNGGRLGLSQISSGVAGNLFPAAGAAEQLAGSSKYRKLFLVNHSNPSDTAFDAKVYMENYTPGADELVFCQGTQTDTQSAITGSEAKFGVGQLNANVIAGATSIAVSVHDWASLPIFRNGGLLRISDKPDIASPGNTEFVYIHASTPITNAGDLVTIPLATALVGGYTAVNTRVASVLEYGDLKATFDNWVETSGAGTYDEVTYPLGLDNRGTIEQIWTVTFSSATNYTVSGDTVGAVGSGTISTDFIPNNPNYSAPYFTLEQEGFAGTWANGNTLVFRTHPAAIPLWMLRDIPSGTTPQAGNVAKLALLAGSN